jgi:cob(I)alamin adenosyltransferase
MSITTRQGDAGMTGLMYNRRVSKCHPRVQAYGGVDELNAALGVARAAAGPNVIGANLLPIQNELVMLMGELATHTDDLERYAKDGYPRITPEQTSKLDGWIRDVEAQKISFRGWATPGSSSESAALDMARTICRRAERDICALHERGELRNAEIIIYLNRLSDLLWLWARWVETQAPGPSGPRPV